MPQAFKALSDSVQDEVLYRVRYTGYLDREMRTIAKLAKTDKMRIPQELDYAAVKGLRAESAQKLAEVRPSTLGQASRISGVNPTDITILMIALGRN